jgi:serine phosphatase RsbU (regulator of sigma subunit)
MRLPATPRPLGFTLLSLLLAGAFAAYVVFSFDRALWVIGGSLVFALSLYMLAKGEASWRQQHATQMVSQQPTPEQIALQNAVREFRARMRPAILRDMMITIALIVLGYIFFVRAFSQEMEKRAAMESELKVAHRIQASLLPLRERKIQGWHLFGTVRPASTVAGDYFDYLELADGRLGVLIADASGHGVAAGLMMAMLKSQLSNMTIEDNDPAILLQRLNRGVRRLAPKHMFVTAALVILPKVNMASPFQIEVVTVGHPPVLHYRASTKAVVEIRTPAFALGLNENLSVNPLKSTLETGDLLLLFTDGLFEQTNAKSNEWGMENVKMALKQFVHLTPPLLCEQILERGAKHRGHQAQHDDITLVAVRPTGE